MDATTETAIVERTISINASSCQLGYGGINPAVVFEYPVA